MRDVSDPLDVTFEPVASRRPLISDQAVHLLLHTAAYCTALWFGTKLVITLAVKVFTPL